MKRIATSVVSFVLVVGALTPAATAADSAKSVFKGAGSARALDLKLPVLSALPIVPLVGGLPVVGPVVTNAAKGLTFGATGVEFSTDPSVKGFAMGNCNLLPDLGSTLPVDLPCSGETKETSSAPGDQGGDDNATCATTLDLAVIKLKTACAKSYSKIVEDKPVSVNEAGVASVNVGLDLKPLLGVDVQGTVNSLVDPVANLLSGVLATVDGITKPILPSVSLQKIVDDTLKEITSLNLGQLATIQVGGASTTVGTNGGITKVESNASAVKIGLLGITDALKDGLIIVDVSPSKAVAEWNEMSGVGTATSTPAIATLQVKDILDLVPGDFLTAVVDLGALNNLLAPLSNTLLDSGIELATSTPAQTGNNVTAATGGVGVYLLRGLGESAPGKKDGGIQLRLSAATAQISGELVRSATVEAPLPHTGGPTTMFLALAAMLGAAAPFMFRFGRKVQKSGSAA